MKKSTRFALTAWVLQITTLSVALYVCWVFPTLVDGGQVLFLPGLHITSQGNLASFYGAILLFVLVLAQFAYCSDKALKLATRASQHTAESPFR